MCPVAPETLISVMTTFSLKNTQKNWLSVVTVTRTRISQLQAGHSTVVPPQHGQLCVHGAFLTPQLLVSISRHTCAAVLLRNITVNHAAAKKFYIAYALDKDLM